MTQPFTRRALFELFTSAGTWWLLRGSMHAQQNRTPAAAAVDHLMLGASDLDRGIDWVEKLTGVRAVVGGTHPGRGTRNALLALHGRQYLEIIAPDPAQPENPSSGLRSLKEPLLIGWAAATADIDGLARRLRNEGLEPVGPRDGSRARLDGRVLRWTSLGVVSKFAASGVDPIPFFIKWAPDSAHPSTDSPKGCQLSALDFEHPDPEGLKTALANIGIEAAVRQAQRVRLVASMSTPKGRVVLR